MNLLGCVPRYLSTTNKSKSGDEHQAEPRAESTRWVQSDEVHSQAKTSSPGVKDGEIQN